LSGNRPAPLFSAGAGVWGAWGPGYGAQTLESKMDGLVEELVQRRIRLRQAVAEFERKFISLVLRENRGNCTRAARQLGIHRNTLLNKMQKCR
jgi:DNA-binding NtrC family response regulator